MAEEFEVTVRVDSEDPEAVFRDISALRSIGPYTLVSRGNLVIHDQYVDTPDSALKKKGYALRLRTHGRDRLLCLKGKERTNAWGGIRRLEIEGPWSEQTLEQIAREAGVLHYVKGSFHGSDPAGTLEGLSLFVIQLRQTSRVLFDIVPESEDDRNVIGEMALDKVCYEIGEKRFLHYELEVEAKGDQRDDVLKGFVSLLKESFPGVLKRWDYNKLITGHALDVLVGQGSLIPDERPNDLIPRSWYNSIERWMKAGMRPDT